MRDTCLFCGRDVSDLGVQVCASCADTYKTKPMLDEIQTYKFSLDRCEKHRLFYLQKLGELPWYKATERTYIEKIIELNNELIKAYSAIVKDLEVRLTHLSYKVMGGDGNLNQMMFDLDK